jgi:hypothetical protein
MMDGRNGDRSGIHSACEFGHGCQRLAAKLSRDGLSLREVGIDHRNQFHTLALLLEFVIDTGVISAERTHPNNSHADCTLMSQVNDFLRVARLTATL